MEPQDLKVGSELLRPHEKSRYFCRQLVETEVLDLTLKTRYTLKEFC